MNASTTRPTDLASIDTDVLVIGGGTAGPMAAVTAKTRRPDQRVMLLDKANVKRSGAISMGMDGLNNAVIPGHATPEQYVREITIANDGICDQAAVYRYAQECYGIIQELDEMDMSSPGWLTRFKTLRHDYEHHIDEEETEIFPVAKDVIGPDIVLYDSDFFIKEAGDESYVSWRQDSTYWGLEPPDVVTAWVALSDAPVESGAMKFKPGSHLGGQIAHSDTFHPKNLLTRGQVIDGDLDLSDAVSVPLRAGEFSLHHIRLAHGSEPNRTAKRRIGFAIRYIGAHVKPVKAARNATLVRGIDQFGHFDLEQAPVLDLDKNALAAHEHAMKGQLEALYSGTDVRTARD